MHFPLEIPMMARDPNAIMYIYITRERLKIRVRDFGKTWGS